MKRFLSLILILVLLMGIFPQAAFAKAKQMNSFVPVWTEETVRQYVLDYVAGHSMDRLYSYFDLQIRRYMPNETFESLLIDYEWMTGSFQGLGSYRSFSEEERKLKTHVVHLCMEKQDLDLYFTHKDKEDDWEIMAVEFVPAAEEKVLETAEMLVEDESSRPYTEEHVTIGAEPYVLEGTLTLPAGASSSAPVPACVLVHDEGPFDRNMTLGRTTLFADIADLMGEMNVATLRYDKRTYTYPEAEIQTVCDEVINDALFAVELLKQDERIDSSRIVVLGVGFGANLTPRIALESNGAVAGMILVGATTENYLETVYNLHKNEVAVLPKEEAEVIKNAVRKMKGFKEEKVRELTLFGRNGYYFWEMQQVDPVGCIKKMRIPTYFVQGKRDPLVAEEDGVSAFRQSVGVLKALYTYEVFRGVNHLLMNDLTLNSLGVTDYSIETHLDLYAGMNLAQWVVQLEGAN